jgi:hypothetical protein
VVSSSDQSASNQNKGQLEDAPQVDHAIGEKYSFDVSPFENNTSDRDECRKGERHIEHRSGHPQRFHWLKKKTAELHFLDDRRCNPDRNTSSRRAKGRGIEEHRPQ